MSPSLPKEIEHIENLAHRFSDKIKLRNLAQIEHQAHSMPLYAVEIGCTSANAPCLILTGAIHGVERIGSQIILVYLKSLLKRASWDKRLADTLDNLKILAVPVVNPWGVALKRRSNHNGVDLMRNSPLKVKTHLITFTQDRALVINCLGTEAIHCKWKRNSKR